MPENKPSETESGDAFAIMVILVRVFIMLALWLGVFLAIFLGYFTVPILVIGLIITVYIVSDLGLFFTLKRRRVSGDQRQEFLESLEDNVTKKE